MKTLAWATATRSVVALVPTSTIRARPDSLKCVNSAICLGESAGLRPPSANYRSRWKGQSRRERGWQSVSGSIAPTPSKRAFEVSARGTPRKFPRRLGQFPLPFAHSPRRLPRSEVKVAVMSRTRPVLGTQRASLEGALITVRDLAKPPLQIKSRKQDRKQGLLSRARRPRTQEAIRLLKAAVFGPCAQSESILLPALKEEQTSKLGRSIDNEHVPVPEWHQQIVQERLESYKANPAGRPWPDVRNDIEEKLRTR
ncbi:addiction module protein [Nitrospira tepida]|uniref:addiction module protein n=1 Tax=Nitrospira tepida TaxID=2973512 RepID=UPI00351F7151